MRRAQTDPAVILEAGLGLLGLAILGGLALLLGSRLLGDAQRGRRHAERPPELGVIPDERHQHIAASSPR
jgi:hypothetical protein